ncbi:hypothetical protein [Streptomyces sp900116325]|uniref:hypothetical protein n=1 Tax=Streptomyces sp. 900116325 TaxID=3154295 RepID=UPI0033A462DF
MGTGRTANRHVALALGLDGLLDLQADQPEETGEFDAFGGWAFDRSVALARAGGALFASATPPTVQSGTGGLSWSSSHPIAPGSWTTPRDSGADGSSRSSAAVRPLAEVPTALVPDHRTPGRTNIRIIED